MKFKMFVLPVMIALASNVFADAVTWLPAKQVVENLDKVILQARQKIHFTEPFSDKELSAATFVYFPQMVPADYDKLYAEFFDKEIVLATTPDCGGVKICSVAHLSFVSDGEPVMSYDKDNQLMTEAVSLHKKITGFYTQGYAMGDFWPAHLDWRCGNVLIRLTWSSLDDKESFIKMANSIIDQSKCMAA